MSYEAPQTRTFDSEIMRLAKQYGQSELLARKIIKCESVIYGQEAIHHNKNGSTDIGYWQINSIHWKTASSSGFDVVNDGWDNLEYGFKMLSDEGTRPWNASKSCWSASSG